MATNCEINLRLSLFQEEVTDESVEQLQINANESFEKFKGKSLDASKIGWYRFIADVDYAIFRRISMRNSPLFEAQERYGIEISPSSSMSW